MKFNSREITIRNKEIAKILDNANAEELEESLAIFTALFKDLHEAIEKGAKDQHVYIDIIKSILNEYWFRAVGEYKD